MISWDDFSLLSPKEQSKFLTDDNGVIQSFVYTQQLTRELIIDLVLTSSALQTLFIKGQALVAIPYRIPSGELRYIDSRIDLKKGGYGWLDRIKCLGSKSCCLYFTQPSTRTFTSFSLAAQGLGATTEEIRDPNISSMYKGESELDTLLTLAALSDIVVMRQADSEFIKKVAHAFKARGLSTRLINAGSGSDQHPTQALLEIATIMSYLRADELYGYTPTESIGKYKISLVGDLKRSRTARSLSYLLSFFPEFEQVFIAPDYLQVKDDIKTHLDEKNIKYSLSDSLDEHIETSDVFYMMRLQDEYTDKESYEGKHIGVLLGTLNEFTLNKERMSKMKSSACILHPLPRRQEVPVAVDFDKRAQYWQAVTVGKYIRMALMMYMMGQPVPWVVKG